MSLQTNYEDCLTFYVKKYIFLSEDLNITVQKKTGQIIITIVIIVIVIFIFGTFPKAFSQVATS